MSWNESQYEDAYKRWMQLFGVRKAVAVAHQEEFTPGYKATEAYNESIENNQFEISKAIHDAWDFTRALNVVTEQPKTFHVKPEDFAEMEELKDELFDEIFAHVEDYIAGNRDKDELIGLIEAAILHYEKRIRD